MLVTSRIRLEVAVERYAIQHLRILAAGNRCVKVFGFAKIVSFYKFNF